MFIFICIYIHGGGFWWDCCAPTMDVLSWKNVVQHSQEKHFRGTVKKIAQRENIRR